MVLTQSQTQDVQGLLENFVTSNDVISQIAASVAKIVEVNLQKTFANQNQIIAQMQGEISQLKVENGALSSENKALKAELDVLQQYSRRNNVRILGIKETVNENLDEIVINLFKSKLNVNLEIDHIDRMHRVGKPTSGSSRQIIVKFTSYRYRKLVFDNKKLLKGTGIRIAEDLTKTRLMLLKEAISRYPRENVWSFDGNIWVNTGGKKILIRSVAEFPKSVK
ncbi:hypothetical protein PPYR_04766 [Photinus pyralis]|uniref:Uncharacterized protein n=1 Tax=Photinus pyralis TaxID=7054 RepID=A0A5N4AZJ7_PHOPY|nr:hypothetical protein PPYR_09806 [Photinus pyralis]KAB0796611.1 hypothetical protein PPYR_10672 [Photinus pyralis]KAB0802580.1 hypothetical protein PPYR_04766 [Photinus pyralis]